MLKEEINMLFSQIDMYTLQGLNEENLSINTINGINIFFYFLEENAKLFMYAHLGRVYATDIELKNLYYKKMLQMNLPLFITNNVRLSVSDDDNIYASIMLDHSDFSKIKMEEALQDFLLTVKNYQESLQSIFSNTEVTMKVKPLNETFDIGMFGTMRV